MFLLILVIPGLGSSASDSSNQIKVEKYTESQITQSEKIKTFWKKSEYKGLMRCFPIPRNSQLINNILHTD